MTRRTRAQAKAITKPNTASHIKLALLSLILLLAFAAQLFAQENITKSHGYSRFGDLKPSNIQTACNGRFSHCARKPNFLMVRTSKPAMW